MPVLIALLPFVAGILLANYFVVPLDVALLLFVAAVLIAYLTLYNRVVWVYAAVALVAFGYCMADLRAPRSTMPYNSGGEMVINVEGIPSQRDGYRVADGRIEQWHDGERWHDCDNRVVLWLRSDSVMHGDELRVYSKLTKRISRYEEYDRLMHRRG